LIVLATLNPAIDARTLRLKQVEHHLGYRVVAGTIVNIGNNAAV